MIRELSSFGDTGVEINQVEDKASRFNRLIEELSNNIPVGWAQTYNKFNRGAYDGNQSGFCGCEEGNATQLLYPSPIGRHPIVNSLRQGPKGTTASTTPTAATGAMGPPLFRVAVGLLPRHLPQKGSEAGVVRDTARERFLNQEISAGQTNHAGRQQFNSYTDHRKVGWQKFPLFHPEQRILSLQPLQMPG